MIKADRKTNHLGIKHLSVFVHRKRGQAFDLRFPSYRPASTHVRSSLRIANRRPDPSFFYLKSVSDGDVKITISDYTGKVIRNIVGTKEMGLNRVQWNLRGEPVRPPQVWWLRRRL